MGPSAASVSLEMGKIFQSRLKEKAVRREYCTDIKCWDTVDVNEEQASTVGAEEG
jgi:hypothetical protein